MATVKTRLLRKALLDKGFRIDKTHHEMYWFFSGERKTSIRTRISHGESEYDDYLLGLVSRQMKLSKQQLLGFVVCALKYSGYLKLLKAAGHVIDDDNDGK